MSQADPKQPFRRAAVVGLGVVGIPVAAKLAEAGVATVGLDVDDRRVGAIAAGRYPFEGDEPGLDRLIRNVHAKRLLTATKDPQQAIMGADVVVIVVQTPIDADGVPRFDTLRQACRSVGPHLQQGALVIVESTLAPGTMRSVVQPTLEEASGKKAGRDFLLGHCPERVMPGRLLRNIVQYERVVGGLDQASTKRMMELYSLFVEGTLYPTDMTTAEVVKTTENAYRDVQIAFANEVARICQVLGVDAWEVREHVNRVEGRNMHLPGVGVGGHCIPKDGLLLAHAARGFHPELLHTARRVNLQMPDATVALVEQALTAHSGQPDLTGRRIVVLGVGYLPGSDDVRDTPTGPLASLLRAKGAEVVLQDPYVHALDGHPVESDLAMALHGADAVILSTAHEAYRAPNWQEWAALMRSKVAIDGRGAWQPAEAHAAGFTYRGIGR